MSVLAAPAAMGTFDPAEVTLLLKDVTGHVEEGTPEEREADIQSGRRHYSETLPVEYRPTPEYLGLFHRVLDQMRRRVALLTAVTAERILEEKGEDVVLVSLARAGTPVGVLLRRWLAHRHGIEAPHATISIVRDRGIDANALRWLLERHPPGTLQFVDGWTGKGVIDRELATALGEFARTDGARLDPELAVLADPGHCATRFGTRADVLVPSACLNATVCGLVSRTVLNDRLVGPDDFHGARWYPELRGEDVTHVFLDAVAGEFDAALDAEVAEGLAAVRDAPPPDRRGMREVEAIRARFGLRDVNLVKPGVGETTRVLLRRMPWKVLVRPDARDELRHVLLLAADRGVEVLEEPAMSYSCCGLIAPQAGSAQ